MNSNACAALRTRTHGGNWFTLFVCFLAALCEGADIVSMGLAAPKLAPALNLSPADIGMALTTANLGLMIGAVVGGRLGDAIGFRWVLAMSVASLGASSLATTLATGPEILAAIRLFTGLGLGGAFPALIGIAAQIGTGAHSRPISMIYCGQPLGAALMAGAVAYLGPSADWSVVFYIGGIAPLLILPLIVVLPKYNSQSSNIDPISELYSVRRSLFGGGRAFGTILLWLASMFTLAVLYIINGWLPSLLVEMGMTKVQAVAISAVENFGATLGCIFFGWLMTRARLPIVVAAAYGGMALSLYIFASLVGLGPIAWSAGFLGLFVVGGQLMLYSLSAMHYPAHMRGVGVGVAVAIGRLGAIAGPWLVGNLLGQGAASDSIIRICTIFVLIGGIAAVALVMSGPGRVGTRRLDVVY